jgi:hypothetical protein
VSGTLEDIKSKTMRHRITSFYLGRLRKIFNRNICLIKIIFKYSVRTSQKPITSPL